MNNLRGQLMVFVIHSGNNPNYPDCVKALEHQNAIFDVQEIVDIAPMSKAFQLMLDLCKTKYFIQVDSDMIIHDQAIINMYADIVKTPANVAMLCYQLLDSHLQKVIYGIKIYKTDIFKKYPYKNCPSCEVEQLDRMKKDGYEYLFREPCQGFHSPKWTDKDIFERYYNLAQKYRLYGYCWMGTPLKERLEQIFYSDPSHLNRFALSGYNEGLVAPLIEEEKDFRKHLPIFKKIANENSH